MLLLLLLCSCAGGRDPVATGDGGASDGAASDGGTSDGAASDGGTADHCAEVEAFVPVYGDTVATWLAQDEAAPGPADPLVFVGSSSIRRWEGLALAYTDHNPVQRGFGGAQLGEVALHADALINRHDPRGVVVFAGTNDIAYGVPPEVVVERLRCLRQRVPATVPLLFIAITPTPARWHQWDQASAVNEAARALAEADPSLVYVDVATPFLATGAPPDAALFVSDGLHLSDAGYALWDSAIRPAVEAAVEPTPPGGGAPLPAGTRLLVDLGPSNPEDGEPTPSPDYLGQHWNNWHAVDGGDGLLPGEHLDQLRTSTGAATEVDLVIAGGFSCNGRKNGGLYWPSQDLLGSLAVGTATQDFLYTSGDDLPGALYLRELDPSARYMLRLYAGRDDGETRITRYVVRGATEAQATLQTSGPGAGSGGTQVNDDDVVELTGVQADAWGHLQVDVEVEAGSHAYLSLLELVVE